MHTKEGWDRAMRLAKRIRKEAKRKRPNMVRRLFGMYHELLGGTGEAQKRAAAGEKS